MSREPTRTGLSADTLQRAVRDNLIYLQARFPEVASPHDWYLALSYSVRDRMLSRWGCEATYFEPGIGAGPLRRD